MTRSRDDGGAAVAEFALVSGLVAVIFAAILQLALALHVRNTLLSCAFEGARVAARADSGPEFGVLRTQELITDALTAAYATDVQAQVGRADEADVVEITVVAPLPMMGLIGPGDGITVHARAYLEEQ